MSESIYLSGEYIKNNPTWHAEDSVWKSEQIAKALRISSIDPKNVCEIGCGAGNVTTNLAGMFPDAKFVGYEISEQAYAISKPTETSNCRFVLGGLEQAYTSTGYDLAMAIDVFEHVENPFDFLRQMRGLAEFKLFHIPLDLSALGVAIDNLMWARRSVGHLHYYSRSTALALLAECGYKIVHCNYTHSYILPFKNFRTGGVTIRKLLKVGLLGVPRVVLTAVSPVATERLLGGLSLMVIAQ